jgi:long-chain fatty acid transport protein
LLIRRPSSPLATLAFTATTASILLATLTLLPSPARAGGILAARFGGEQGHPMTDDPSAIYYNPAGLSLKRGTRLHLNGLLAWRLASYDRPTGAIDNPLPSGAMGAGTPQSDLAVNAGKAELSNVIVSPFLALTTDFGVKNLGVGVGFAVPFGGQASWNQNAAYRGSLQYPGAVDGVQRWATIDGVIRSQYIMIGGSYTIPRARLSIGATVNIILNEANTVRARTAAGTDDVTTNGIPTEGRSQIEAKNVTASLGVGVIWQPADNWWLGVSYQSQPGFGEHRLSGTLRNKIGNGDVTEQPIELTQNLPDVLRFGFRVRPIRRLELRLFAEYQRWSVFKNQCVLDATVADRKCAVLPDGSLDTANGGAGVVVVLPRDWKDGGGVRLGASYFVRDNVELYLGAGYDANVIPDKTLDPSMIDQEKVTVSAGGRLELVRRKLGLALTYTQVIYLDRTAPVRARDADGQPIAPLAPSRNPDFGGKYSQALGLVSLALEYNFTGP